MISWGLRMALSGTLPVLWGLATHRLDDALWITLTAEAIAWVELKGSFTWRVRTLMASAFLAIAFSFFGIITGSNIWLGVIGMFVVGFIATLLKNIGDRASGLALSVYLMFIICNAFQPTGVKAIEHRMVFVAIGAVWPVLVGLFVSLLMPAEEPYRRQIALVWRAIAALVSTISKPGDGEDRRKISEELYHREKDVRTAIDNSYEFFGRMVHQVNKDDHQKYQLALLRKGAGLVAVNMIAIGEEMENITIGNVKEPLRIKAAALFGALYEAVSRISIYVITLKPEEKLLAVSHIKRARNLIGLIKEYPLPPGEPQTLAINRILQLIERSAKLMENGIQRIEQMGKDIPVFRSYSLVKTSFILKPKYLLRNLQVLFNFNSINARYALRSAIAASAGMFVYKWLNIDHGYWVPFSVMIVIQPYFGATFKKAIDRVIGTLLGGIAGSLLLHVPANLHVKEIILFLTFVFMVYFIRKNYAIAAFVITLNLVLLFNIEGTFNTTLMVTRAICTIGGALLAIGSGFALFPTWDKKRLPAHMAAAIQCNYEYFMATFYSPERITNWTKLKRVAESKNTDVFDSFNRYMQEPGDEKPETWYDLITINIRITRNLNNIHLEQDEKKHTAVVTPLATQQQKINNCRLLFLEVLKVSPKTGTSLTPGPIELGKDDTPPVLLNDAQMVSLEKLSIELMTMVRDLQSVHK